MLGAALVSCSIPNISSPTPPATPASQSQAAGLRTHLDLLLSEQVMIIAKESAAAATRSDEYAGYTGLLATNSAELVAMVGRAFGTTAAAQFAQAWNMQNGYLVDYAIGVVTHNDDKANAAMSGLTGKFVPQFAQLVSDLTRLPPGPVTQLTSEQVLEDKAFIDDVVAARYTTFYSDLHRAYVQTSRFGDVLAAEVVLKFPDKFPGDLSTQSVNVRVSFNELLQEHSYLATMATDAVVAGRSSESAAAAAALAANGEALRTAFAGVHGSDAATELDRVWTARNKMLIDYASGASPTAVEVTKSFVPAFADVSHVNRLPVLRQAQATIKVIDDQRAKSSKTIAADDRAAATAMQPIADSIEG